MLILAYHRVNPEIRDGLSVSPEMLRRQIETLLERGWRNVLLEESLPLASTKRRAKEFAVTFDDGYQDNFVHAAPVLEELSIQATIYLIEGYIGSSTPFPWVQARGQSHDSLDLHMTEDQIRDLAGIGFRFGSHTLTHPMLSTLDHDRARSEIADSKVNLESRFGWPIETFCYPAGNFAAETVQLVGEAGYRAAVVTPNRMIAETALTLHRVGVYSNMTERLYNIKTHPLFGIAQRSGSFWWMRHTIDPRHRSRPSDA